jgi:hypothetical protein
MVNSQNAVQKENYSFSFFARSLTEKFGGKAAFMGYFVPRDLLG